MTYITGGNIQAADYNNFTTLSTGVNEIYADNYSGATTLPTAGFGYGQSPLVGVSAGASVQASEWAALFQVMRACGTHQGTTVSPPVPVTDPVAGDEIVAENTGSTMAATIALLQSNKHNLFAGQTTLTPGSVDTSVSSWTTLLTYSFQTNFGSWNNARYFFNSGGSLQIVGTYTTGVTPVELAWKNAISTPTAPFTFNWNSTEAATGSNDAPLHPIGFWNPATNNPLTTSYQIVYYKAIGGGYYGSNFVQIEAKLAAAAGTNGLIDFRISLIDGDVTPDSKVAGIAFQVNNAKSDGAIAYPGPAVIITSGGFTYA